MAIFESTTESRNPLWVRLQLSCDAAISLAREVAASLLQNATTDTYLPLLKRQREFVNLIYNCIAQLPDQASNLDRHEREHLAEKMRTLVDLDEQNHRHLTQRGARLNSPSRKHHPQNHAGR